MMFSKKCVTALLLSSCVLASAKKPNLRKLQGSPLPELISEAVPELFGEGGGEGEGGLIGQISEAVPELFGEDGDAGGLADQLGSMTETFGAVQDMLCEFLPFFCTEQEASSICPAVKPLVTLDLDRYISSSWFVQKQQVNPYQSEEQLYCVVATYETNDEGGLTVNNYGNNDEVNGTPQNMGLEFLGMDTMSFESMVRQQGGIDFEMPVGFDEDMDIPAAVAELGMNSLTEEQLAQLESLTQICAEQIKGGELQVAPCVFQPIFDFVAGPYWVLAVDEVDYSWAIVSGGKPDVVRQTEPTPLCTTKEGSSFLDVNGSGLWLFTREKVADPSVVEAMENKLLEMGIYTGDLKPVTQQGCLYEGAVIKSPQTAQDPAN